jgi:hypothetical protein
LTVDFWLFAKLKVARVGRISHSIPNLGAAFMKDSIAGRDPIALVHPRSRIAYVGFSDTATN